jgi:uncharacterized protein YlxW (UPF0749 family)
MKKVIFGTGVLVVLTTLGFMLAGKLNLSTVGLINTSVLGFLYGWYQKLQKDNIETDLSLISFELDYTKTRNESLLKESVELMDSYIQLKNETETLNEKLKTFTTDIPELKKVVENTIEEVKETKPKRKRNIKK